MEDRPMSILTSLGFYNHIKGQDLENRRKASEMLLGRHGPKNINEVLASSKIENTALARSAVQSSVSMDQINYMPEDSPGGMDYEQLT